MLIDNIKSPKDLKKLSRPELKGLAKEIREFLIESVFETGGHLSSNLGAIELTLAIHYVFDAPNDKIVWDVGHQTYTHKIITGRKDMMSDPEIMPNLNKKAEEGAYLHILANP